MRRTVEVGPVALLFNLLIYTIGMIQFGQWAWRQFWSLI